jgi:hypothetical protein
VAIPSRRLEVRPKRQESFDRGRVNIVETQPGMAVPLLRSKDNAEAQRARRFRREKKRLGVLFSLSRGYNPACSDNWSLFSCASHSSVVDVLPRNPPLRRRLLTCMCGRWRILISPHGSIVSRNKSLSLEFLATDKTS